MISDLKNKVSTKITSLERASLNGSGLKLTVVPKVVIVTGAASGIGLATAESFVNAGAKVFGCDINPAPSALASHENFEYLKINLTNETAGDDVVKGCLARFGDKIDGLLNVAGIMDTNNSVDTLQDAVWDKTIAINLTSPVKLMRAVVPVMKKHGGGSIVNVASKAGTSGAIAGVAYTASKHGLVGATKNVAWRFKNDGIRCNAICPGGSISMDDMDQDAYAAIKPVHELHTVWHTGQSSAPPQLLANVLLFLVSDMSAEMSGAIIPVDHAWSTI
ncbi:hypothetical protein PV11_03497 [Exophiala sideris]|uniref:Uncharacterized protein n=1 Tax=Exophiala sideris TaxID=1016849 RepID=A0A0D1YEB6_9EURO|nr:hypothetical protein PV11_03497 [Exophiala sideris]